MYIIKNYPIRVGSKLQNVKSKRKTSQKKTVFNNRAKNIGLYKQTLII